MDTFLRPCIEDFRFSMSEHIAALLLLVLVLVLLLALLLLLLLQPVTSTAVTTHAAASRPPNALHRMVTPLLIAGQARQLDSPVEASSRANPDASPTSGEPNFGLDRRPIAHSRGSTGSDSSARTAKTHSCIRHSGSPRASRSRASRPRAYSRRASGLLRASPRWRSLARLAGSV